MKKKEKVPKEKEEQVQEQNEEQQEPKEEKEVNVEPFRLDKYALVATIANNGLILLYEFKPIEEARKIAQRTYERM